MPLSVSEQIKTILQNTSRFVDGLSHKSEAALEEIGDVLTSAAQSNHPYADQTGDLTASIRAFIDEATPTVVRLVFAAEMDYAVFVELCKGGQYAFLLPVVEAHEGDIRGIIARRLAPD